MYTGKPSSSLPLQIVLYIEQVYSWVYFLLEGLLYVFRGQFLAYPTHALNLELAGLFFFGVVQLTRVFLGSFQIGTIGNKTERSDILVWGLILLFPSLLGGIFFIRLQVYVLFADIVLNIILLFFMVVDFFLMLVTMIGFKKQEKLQ